MSAYQSLFDPSAEQLISVVVERTLASILHAWRESRDGHIVITGGRTGLAIAQTLDVNLFRLLNEKGSDLDEALTLHIWFSDERFVGFDDVDRSDTTLVAAFTRSLNRLTFHRVAAPASASKIAVGELQAAADLYSAALDQALPDTRRFDAVIMSVGEDGHIASLFPGHTDELNSTKSAVAVDNSPKPPAQRVSIGTARLARACAIYIFAVGEGKRAALADLLDGGQQSPISMLRENSPATQIVIATDIKI